MRWREPLGIGRLVDMTESRYRAVKAYENLEWINSRDARPLRILAEYLEPESRFEEMNIEDTIVVFGSARLLPRDVAEERLEETKRDGGDVAKAERDLKMSDYYEAARELSFRLTEWSKNLQEGKQRFVVCSGGEARDHGGREPRGLGGEGGLNIGLNISLPFEQNDNPYITRRLSLEFHYFFMRKFWFTYLAKAIVVMPGGFGTLDEFMEVVTLVQTLKIKKGLPIVLFGKDFWSNVINFQTLIRRVDSRRGTLVARILRARPW